MVARAHLHICICMVSEWKIKMQMLVSTTNWVQDSILDREDMDVCVITKQRLLDCAVR